MAAPNIRGVVRGGCRCGAVLVRATGSPTVVLNYHCLVCRRSSGAPVSLFAGYRTEQVGLPGVRPKGYESSPGVYRFFCGTCGTPISFEDERLPGEPTCTWASSTTPGPSSPRSTSGGPGACAGSMFGMACRATKKAASCGRERRPSPS
jgi:hypothetical protein